MTRRAFLRADLAPSARTLLAPCPGGLMEASANPVAIVTGAGQGIGRVIVARLLRDGYRVGAFERDSEALAELLSEHQQAQIKGYEVDVGNESSVRDAVDATASHFGALD